jgi:hypothetical protein
MSMVSPQLRKSAADSRDRGGAPEGGKVLVDADERDRVLQAGAAAQAGGVEDQRVAAQRSRGDEVAARCHGEGGDVIGERRAPDRDGPVQVAPGREGRHLRP